jgi:hypothetical protein
MPFSAVNRLLEILDKNVEVGYKGFKSTTKSSKEENILAKTKDSTQNNKIKNSNAELKINSS